MRLSGRKASSSLPRWRPPPRVVLASLIGVNLAFFIAQMSFEVSAPGVISKYLGLSYRGIDQAYAWQFFTAMFLQGGVLQFGGSMLVLFFLGRDVESILGQKHFLYLYFGGLLGGELGHLFLMPAGTVLLAAPGGIAALIVAFGTILPELELAESIFFFLPVRLKAKHFAYLVFGLGLLLLVIDRRGVVSHSAFLGGGMAGWLYAHSLGFGRPSPIQRFLRERRQEECARRQMSAEEFIAEKIDPILDKISRGGWASLTRSERRTLAQAREKMAAPPR